MVAFGWINMFSCLILVLQLRVTVQNPTPYAARVGVTVSLPCKGLTDYQCSSITWLFSHSGRSITLHEHGKILEAKSGQLSVGSNCSLNIKMVTLEDAGRYTCRQFRSGQQHGEDTVYDISVVNGEETNTSPIKPGAATSTTIKSASKGTSTSKTAKPKATKSKSGPNTTATNGPPKKQAWWWWLIIILAVGLTLLIITVVLLIKWRRAKGNKTKTGENMADSVDGVSYASISYTKRNNNKVQVQDKNDDEDDAVTYSTVKTSSSPAGASADLNDLYATVNKLNK
ncbi:uncharacterized protein LOC121955719 [Plectropomus leopardus]|uniref:uncharacterized protein LOC121955719 n=1 Tax=Plectropomus leopardus TaxID=160734 RepID=UPI001C4DCE43|nr:uncharacterized protein LOC121955719 [Plectropomus leopardus]